VLLQLFLRVALGDTGTLSKLVGGRRATFAQRRVQPGPHAVDLAALATATRPLSRDCEEVIQVRW
jgi:hypothetical protein